LDAKNIQHYNCNTKGNSEKRNVTKDEITQMLNFMSIQDETILDELNKQIFNNKFAKLRELQNKNLTFNRLLSTALTSVEQIMHQSKFLDEKLQKTKIGNQTYGYRFLMRQLIANKERNMKLVVCQNLEENFSFIDGESNKKITRKEIINKFISKYFKDFEDSMPGRPLSQKTTYIPHVPHQSQPITTNEQKVILKEEPKTTNVSIKNTEEDKDLQKKMDDFIKEWQEKITKI
jgi:hypothetical protein